MADSLEDAEFELNKDRIRDVLENYFAPRMNIKYHIEEFRNSCGWQRIGMYHDKVFANMTWRYLIWNKIKNEYLSTNFNNLFTTQDIIILQDITENYLTSPIDNHHIHGDIIYSYFRMMSIEEQDAILKILGRKFFRIVIERN